jgi:hypothetical protein
MTTPNPDAIGLFVDSSTFSIPAGTDRVRTSGYSQLGRGAAAYIYDAAVDAAFVTAHPGWAFKAGGRGFRLEPEQRVTFEMFGAVGDATASVTGTDNYGAWLKAKDFVHCYRVYPSGNPYYKPSVPLHFAPAGYRFSHFLDLDDAAYELFGSGSPGSAGGGGTTFFFDSGQPGLVLQSWDTAGTNSVNQPNNSGTPHGASNSHVRDLTLVSRGGTVGSSTQHGVNIKCNGTHFERVQATHFGGDGFHIYANAPGAGNANTNRISFCSAHNNGLNGIFTGAGDANAIVIEQFQANYNRKFGIAECSFLGNHYFGYHLQSNGMSKGYGAGPNWAAASDVPGARCTYNGHYWLVAPAQDTAAATTTPGTNPSVWIDIGTTGLGFADPWVSGYKYAAGGAIIISNVNYTQNNNNRTLMTGYVETDQPAGFGLSGVSLCLNGNGGVGPALSSVNGILCAGSIGSRNADSSGTIYNRQIGGDPNNAGQVESLYLNDGEGGWSWHYDKTNKYYFPKWLNADGSPPYYMLPLGYSVGMSFPRGIALNAIDAADDAAAAAAGVGVNQVYRTGSALKIRVS